MSTGKTSLAKKEIDWENLGFEYRAADYFVKHVWRDGEWDRGEMVSDPHLNLHIAATALHYGQAAFEGLKAFECADGTVHIFRPWANAHRMERTARRICMATVPEDLFLEAVQRTVEANLRYVPPYGTGGALYIRPLLIGSSPQIGVAPATEYIFLVMVLPVGPYYKGGLQPVRAVVLDEYDRAAPQGVGNVKVAGNYAASLEPHRRAHELGFNVELYLDSKENRYVEEFGTSNFIGITAEQTYVTPTSQSILPSITNDSLQQIAREEGLDVEQRPVPFEEAVAFSEVGACGTAVVLTPISEIVRGENAYRVGPDEGCGPTLQHLYNQVTGIQHGELEDPYGWTLPVNQ